MLHEREDYLAGESPEIAALVGWLRAARADAPEVALSANLLVELPEPLPPLGPDRADNCRGEVAPDPIVVEQRVVDVEQERDGGPGRAHVST